MPAAGPEVGMDQLRHSVANFAAALHETSVTVAAAGDRRLLAAATAPAATPADALAEFSADFVTPGDLFRSHSLTTMGELRP